MFQRRKNLQADVVLDTKTEDAITKARHLHDELVHHGVPAREVPAAIFQLRAYYHQALKHDQKNFKKQDLGEMYIDVEAVKKMRILLNKFVHYGLNENDKETLAPLSFPEADHLREFLRFEDEAKTYARSISEYLIRLKKEISSGVKVDKSGRELMNYPNFYKGSVAPRPIARILKILEDIEKDLLPVSLFEKFDKVFDIFAEIKPSKTRTPAREAFYEKHWEEIKQFSFIKQIGPSEDEEAEDSVEVIYSRNSM